MYVSELRYTRMFLHVRIYRHVIKLRDTSKHIKLPEHKITGILQTSMYMYTYTRIHAYKRREIKRMSILHVWTCHVPYNNNNNRRIMHI